MCVRGQSVKGEPKMLMQRTERGNRISPINASKYQLKGDIH